MASIWKESRQRNVVNVAVAYAIVGWLPAVSFVSTSSLADEYDDVVIADAHVHIVRGDKFCTIIFVMRSFLSATP